MLDDSMKKLFYSILLLYFRTYENNISEGLVAFISIVEDGVSKFLRNVGTCLQNYTSSGAKRLLSLSPSGGLQISMSETRLDTRNLQRKGRKESIEMFVREH
jgi:hypothetical protein